MRRTRIKFCGMTRAEDVELACALGVDALGFIFAPRSSRVLGIEQARVLVAAAPPRVTRVGLFLDAPSVAVRAVLDRVALEYLQFHGDESADFCEQFGRPYLKAVAMGDATEPMDTVAAHPNASGFVFDAHARGGSGGGGVPFDWSRLPPPATAGSKPVSILAGGLSAENVFEAVKQVRPWAVDVVSGIESAPGHKDAARMRAFINEVERADDANHTD
ncbi:MAG: phosphoribosylanthranilate isomerase [Lysobacterales bacterium]